MNRQGWLHRLSGTYPNWWIFYSSGVRAGWYAIPIIMPDTIEERIKALAHSYKLGPYATPQLLRYAIDENIRRP